MLRRTRSPQAAVQRAARVGRHVGNRDEWDKVDGYVEEDYKQARNLHGHTLDEITTFKTSYVRPRIYINNINSIKEDSFSASIFISATDVSHNSVAATGAFQYRYKDVKTKVLLNPEKIPSWHIDLLNIVEQSDSYKENDLPRILHFQESETNWNVNDGQISMKIPEHFFERQNIRAKLKTNFLLGSFPFDEQVLKIELSLDVCNYIATFDRRWLLANRVDSGIVGINPNADSALDMADWNIDKDNIFVKGFNMKKHVDPATDENLYRDNAFTFSKLVVFIPIYRDVSHYAYVIFVPLILIILSSVFVFMEIDLSDECVPEGDDKKLAFCQNHRRKEYLGYGDSITFVATLLLSVFAMKFTFANYIPRLSYPTTMDKIFIFSYVYIFGCFIALFDFHQFENGSISSFLKNVTDLNWNCNIVMAAISPISTQPEGICSCSNSWTFRFEEGFISSLLNYVTDLNRNCNINMCNITMAAASPISPQPEGICSWSNDLIFRYFLSFFYCGQIYFWSGYLVRSNFFFNLQPAQKLPIHTASSDKSTYKPLVTESSKLLYSCIEIFCACTLIFLSEIINLRPFKSLFWVALKSLHNESSTNIYVFNTAAIKWIVACQFVIFVVYVKLCQESSNTDKSKSNTDKSKSDTDKSKSNTDKSKSDTDKSKSDTDKSKSNTDKLKSDTDKSKSNTDESKRRSQVIQFYHSLHVVYLVLICFFILLFFKYWATDISIVGGGDVRSVFYYPLLAVVVTIWHIAYDCLDLRHAFRLKLEHLRSYKDDIVI